MDGGLSCEQGPWIHFPRDPLSSSLPLKEVSWLPISSETNLCLESGSCYTSTHTRTHWLGMPMKFTGLEWDCTHIHTPKSQLIERGSFESRD